MEFFLHVISLNFNENKGIGDTSKNESRKIKIIIKPGLPNKLLITDSFC